MTKKTFPLGPVASVVTGRLLCDIGEVYEVLNFMTGQKLFTHQLPRAGRAATPHIIEQHPKLASVIEEAEGVTPENWQGVLSVWKDRVGTEIELEPLRPGVYEAMGPFTELNKMMGEPRQ